MTKVRVTNNSKAPYGVEKVGGGYRFLDPGEERVIDAANIPALQLRTDLVIEIHADVGAPPPTLAAKAEEVGKPDPLDHDGDGKKGGSRPGPASTRAKGARRRTRREAPAR